MLTPRPESGFSLIELMTAIAIMGVLIALGMPALGTYVQTAKLGTMARSFYTGVQRARAEAIRLNQHVDFVQTSTPIASGVESSAVPSVNGLNWVVRYVDPNGVTQLVEAKSALEGGGSAMTATGSNAVITFNGLGVTTPNAAAQIAVNAPAGQCAPAGPQLCWQVNVSAGGQVRLCNPTIPGTLLTDTRACQ